MFRIGKSIDIESRSVVTRGWRARKWRLITNGYSFLGEGEGDENVQELGRVAVASPCGYILKH